MEFKTGDKITVKPNATFVKSNYTRNKTTLFRDLLKKDFLYIINIDLINKRIYVSDREIPEFPKRKTMQNAPIYLITVTDLELYEEPEVETDVTLLPENSKLRKFLEWKQ